MSVKISISFSYLAIPFFDPILSFIGLLKKVPHTSTEMANSYPGKDWRKVAEYHAKLSVLGSYFCMVSLDCDAIWV